MDLTMLLAAEGEKRGWPELVVVIVVPVVLAFLLYRFARLRVDQGGARWLPWASLVPLVIGVWFGVGPLQDITTKSYHLYNSPSDRSTMLHYAAFGVPVLALVTFVGFLLYTAHRNRMEG